MSYLFKIGDRVQRRKVSTFDPWAGITGSIVDFNQSTVVVRWDCKEGTHWYGENGCELEIVGAHYWLELIRPHDWEGFLELT